MMKQQAEAMAVNNESHGGKYKYVGKPDNEQKCKDKKSYESFLQDVVKHVAKKQHSSEHKSHSGRKNEEQYNLNFEWFRSLHVENSPGPSIINVDSKSHLTSSQSSVSQLHSALMQTSTESEWHANHCLDIHVNQVEESFNIYTTTTRYKLLDRCLNNSYVLLT